MRWKALALLILFGATIGTLLDALHTFSATTEYVHPFVLRTAWWVPLLFAGAYGVGGFLYADAHKRMRGPEAMPSRGEAIAGVAIFAALYAASAYLPASNAIKLVVLMIGAIGLWAWLDRSAQGIVLSAAGALAGPFVEIVLTRAGMFRHRQPDVLGIPIWLPALYLAAGPSFGQFARTLCFGDDVEGVDRRDRGLVGMRATGAPDATGATDGADRSAAE